MTPSRGPTRERQLCRWLEERGWFCQRAPASKGPADIVAVRPHESGTGCLVWFIEVKASAKKRGPFADFPPAARERLIEVAESSGAIPMVAWWAPRCEPQFFPKHLWPPIRVK